VFIAAVGLFVMFVKMSFTIIFLDGCYDVLEKASDTSCVVQVSLSPYSLN